MKNVLYFRALRSVLFFAIASMAGMHTALPDNVDDSSQLPDLLSGGPAELKVHLIGENNPDKKIVEADMSELRVKVNPAETVVTFLGPWQLEGEAMKKVYPGWRFYLIAWTEADADPKNHMLGRAMSPNYTLAIDPGGKITKLYYSYPNGELLVEPRIRIRSQEDAELIWKAQCEIFRRGDETSKCEKVSATEWKLGVHSFASDGKTLTVFVTVTVDADGFCTSAKREMLTK